MDEEKEEPLSPTHVEVKSNFINTHSVYHSAEEVDDNSNNCQQSSNYAGSCLYFSDGIRSIDFVLVWDESYTQSMDENAKTKRQVFEDSLKEEGLELEYEDTQGGGLHFIKVHATLEVLRRYSEILKFRMPMKKELCTMHKQVKQNRILQATTFLTGKEGEMYWATDLYDNLIPTLHERTWSAIDSVTDVFSKFMKNYVYVDKKVFPDRGRTFTAVYSRDKEYLFDIDASDFFTPAARSRIVQFILDRSSFNKDKTDVFHFGIERLVASYVYSAAYPLHDGDLKTPGSMRYLLYTEWASIKKCFRYQPIDHIKNYFGIKIGLYFAWLGFYTHMLTFASIVGLMCFIYSTITLHDNDPSQDICNQNLSIKMCPLCDRFCDYWDLSETCYYAKVTYLFDNNTTVFFAVFMSFWATMFLELWKRYSAEITHRWDLTGWDTQEEHPRPQYLARLAHLNTKHTRMNIVTNTVEPKVPFWTIRFPATLLSFSVVLLLVTLALATVLAVVLYRMSVLAALSVYGDEVITSYAILFTTATAASINLTCIFLFNWVYGWLAEYLTELEMLRTQTEFDDSLTLKMYLLQFVNYYASIFYIAFFKGKLVGFPAAYNRILGTRQEECGPGGCLTELCIQLAIIMIGKQASNTVIEMLYPLAWKWWNSVQLKRRSMKRGHTQWEQDYKLVDWGSQGLFSEYLEMVLQYGFVTIFVSAFPLAPLFALLNNILEMRLDAKKLLTFHRRFVSQRVRDIGVWFKILNSVGKLAVITNAFIIAFTSDFVPRTVYTLMISDTHSLEGFLNNSLSFMNTSDLDLDSPPKTKLDYCRYSDYREPPWKENKYERTNMYWRVLAARLAFVVIFENVVVMVVLFVQWLVPDMPSRLRDQIHRENYITNEIIIAQEAKRARCNSSIFNSVEDMKQVFSRIRHLSENREDRADLLNDRDDDDDDDPEAAQKKSNGRVSQDSKFTKEEIKDAALVHKPENLGEISEVSV
ncbi:hypothetical protein LSTR_LSTR000977 [Laodelphax striatellus]|uniref:Anoctamin n=1 Tax=Laodelphax striatellus TaxID=195883 RepID=A0A482X1K2_LAOST|nr:hypothetical protein LSTR_LSTR000977 [Laodelphax striatellus]